ncbi:class I SAM-dependent methyltransferase [Dactylosporangium sp. NPDC049140]|uniref:class I SAM-dependent methyltransferase n=1 Tax=Dactylosporangium sp. NPDC049140 TaxID=3155647 RepID=UPI003402BF15
MPDWNEAADWYASMLDDPARPFNDLAATVALDLLGPVAGRTVLDLGCGEGHVSRRLARAGATVIGVDPTARLLELAAEHTTPPGIRYLHAAAEDLSGLTTASVDAVCAVLVLHHTDPLPTALREAHRVLRPGGTLAAVIPHPAFDHAGAAWAEGRRVVGAYADERHWSTPTRMPGRVEAVHNIGWHHRTVSTWLNALAEAGFTLERAVEPLGQGAWERLPRFLAFRATAGRSPARALT